MTVRIVATVTCDECGAELVIDESNLMASYPSLYAGERGWRWDTKGNNFCPPCTERQDNPSGATQLLMEMTK